MSRTLVLVGALAATLLVAAPAQAAPDLKVAFLNPLTDGVDRGDRFAAKTRVKNVGDTRARRTKVGYYLSLDRKRGRDIALTTQRTFGSLAVGRSQRRNAKLTPPTLAFGRFYLIACADARRQVKESNERNNCRIARGPLAIRLAALDGIGSGGTTVIVGGGTTPANTNPGTTNPGTNPGGGTTDPGGGTTPPPPPVPLPRPDGLATTSPNAGEITLTWSAVDEATSYTVERGTSSTGPFTAAGTSTTPTFTDTSGLSPATRYFYRVVAHGTRPDSPTSEPEPGLTRPAAPAGLATQTATRTRLDLAWNAVNSADGYRLYRGPAPSGPYALVASTTGSGATTALTDPSALPPATDFSYVVRAYNASGESADSQVLTQTTAPPQPDPPAANAANPTTVDLTWPGVPTAQSYRVLKTTGVGNPFVEIGTTSATTFQDPSSDPDTPYAYRIVAVNAGGESPESASGTVTTPPATLPEPTNVTAAAPSANRIDVTWTAVTGAASYRIQRGDTSTGPFTDVGTTVNNAFSDTPGLQPATTYHYRVIALAPASQSGGSNVASALTRTAAPENLRTVTTRRDQLTLGWDQVTGATGYRVYRSADPGGPFVLQHTIGSGTTTNVTSNPISLPTNTDFHYLVRAVNASGESADSNHHTQVTVPAAPSITSALPTGPNSSRIEWAAVPGATAYIVRRGDGAAGSLSEIGATAGGTTAFTDNSLTPHSSYTYDVIAVNGGGAGEDSAGRLITTDYACTDSQTNHTQGTAQDIGTVRGDTGTDQIVFDGVLCRGEEDWLVFHVVEAVAGVEQLSATVSAERGADLNGKEENIRVCVVSAFTSCSGYGVGGTGLLPPLGLSLIDNQPIDPDDYLVYVAIDGETPAANNTYTITVNGNTD